MNTANILTGDEYLALPREPQAWLLKPLLPIGGAMILYGDPKVGKSYAALQLSLALSGATQEWLGFPVVKKARVVYVQLDTPRSLWAERLEALKASGHPIGLLYLADRETLGTWPFDILNPDHEELLRSSLAPFNADVVILDTLKEAATGDENDATEMQQVIAKLTAATQPSALVVVHHARKANFEHGPSTMDDIRGSSYIAGKFDAICRMSAKGLYYTGRAIEMGSVNIARGEDGFWEVDDNEKLAELSVSAIIADSTLKTQREKSRALALRLSISEEAARSKLRRIGKK